jgi:hypothetical protein
MVFNATFNNISVISWLIINWNFVWMLGSANNISIQKYKCIRVLICARLLFICSYLFFVILFVLYELACFNTFYVCLYILLCRIMMNIVTMKVKIMNIKPRNLMILILCECSDRPIISVLKNINAYESFLHDK